MSSLWRSLSTSQSPASPGNSNAAPTWRWGGAGCGSLLMVWSVLGALLEPGARSNGQLEGWGLKTGLVALPHCPRHCPYPVSWAAPRGRSRKCHLSFTGPLFLLSPFSAQGRRWPPFHSTQPASQSMRVAPVLHTLPPPAPSSVQLRTPRPATTHTPGQPWEPEKPAVRQDTLGSLCKDCPTQ